MYHRKRKLDQNRLTLTQRRILHNEAPPSTPKTPIEEVLFLDDSLLGSIDFAKAEKEYWDTQEKQNQSPGRIVDCKTSPLVLKDCSNSRCSFSSPPAKSFDVKQPNTGGLSPVQSCFNNSACSSVQSCFNNSACSPDLFANSKSSPGFNNPLNESTEEKVASEITNTEDSMWDEFLSSGNDFNLGCEPQLESPIKEGNCHEGESDEIQSDLLLDYSVCVNVNRTEIGTGSNKENHNDVNQSVINQTIINQSKIVAYTTLIQELGISKMNWSTDDSILGMKNGFLAPQPPVNRETSMCFDFNQQMKERLQGNATKPISRKPITPKKVEPATTKNDQFFGLPENVYKLVKRFKGIDDLYDWQKTCLSLPAVKNHGNLVYALPTSGGKTLVAEVLILKELLVHQKNVIFILPYVSIVQEKVRALSPFALELNFFVEEYASNKGVFPPRQRRKKCSVYVATIEKGLGLVNSLLSEGRLSEIGLVVVDELHLIGEGTRGATLEGMITKVLYSQVAVQTVAMSATIGNIEELATFLQAVVFTEDFRPVALTEYVKYDNDLFMINRSKDKGTYFTKARTLEKSDPANRDDPDLLGQLVMEVVPEESVLVFCRSRKNCENVAQLICGGLSKDLTKCRVEEKMALYRALQAEGNGKVCPTLIKTLPYGVAYHHSGLTLAERRLLEEAFLAKTVCVICCTSTLAAGVNLPARRVIIRAPYIGMSFLDLARYKQMIGRAGRTGLGEKGESIIICTAMDLPKLRDVMVSPMEEVVSKLDEDEGSGMSKLIMSSIDLKLTSSLEELDGMVAKTLLSVQTSKKNINIRDLIEDAVKRLIREGGVVAQDPTNEAERDEERAFQVELPNEKSIVKVYPNSVLALSKIGKAAVKAGQTLATAQRIYADLKKAGRDLVMTSELHLLYLISPYSMTESIHLDGQAFFKAFFDLKEPDLHTAEIIGINQGSAVKIMKGGVPERVPKETIDRFYVAMILYDLWREKSIWDVSTKFQVARGQIYSLMTAVPAFSSSVLRFTEDFEEFWHYKVLLSEMSTKLAHFCCLELQPLMELPSVKIGRARQLYQAGYRTILDVAKADPNDIARSLDHMPRNVARQIVASAKLMLIAKAETLQEDAQLVLEGLGQVKLQLP